MMAGQTLSVRVEPWVARLLRMMSRRRKQRPGPIIGEALRLLDAKERLMRDPRFLRALSQEVGDGS